MFSMEMKPEQRADLERLRGSGESRADVVRRALTLLAAQEAADS
jgi:Arc/MetJ-type ribon-helix-helix transcriptional regulator